MRHDESRIQQACVRWFRCQYPALARLLFAIPNGGRRSRIEAAIMQSEGVTPGVPDLMLAYPRNGAPGLFVEIKSESGTATHYQRDMINLLSHAGYTVAVCRSLDQFIETIKNYLK